MKDKDSLEQLIDSARLLVSRIRDREVVANNMYDSINHLHTQLIDMRRFQEDLLTFNELCDRTSSHPKSQLIVCLAAENKQMEQLQAANDVLRISLEEHQTALDMIMDKYRTHVSKLIQANQCEGLLRNKSLASSTQPSETNSNDPPTCSLTTNGTSASTSDITSALSKLNSLASMAKDVCDHGDAYSAEMETELQRLRAENNGLREMLAISSSFDHIDSTNSATSNNSVLNHSNQTASTTILSNQQSSDCFSSLAISDSIASVPSPPRNPTHVPARSDLDFRSRQFGAFSNYEVPYGRNPLFDPDSGIPEDEVLTVTDSIQDVGLEFPGTATQAHQSTEYGFPSLS